MMPTFPYRALAALVLLLLLAAACGGDTPPTSTPIPPSPTLPPAVPPTATLIPPTPAPKGSTLTVASWVMTLIGIDTGRSNWPPAQSTMGSLKTGPYTGPTVTANGQFRTFYMEAQNRANATRTLSDTLVIQLIDEKGAVYTPLEQSNPTMAEAITAIGGSPLTLAVTPDGQARPILVFDVGTGRLPAQLILRALDGEQGIFDANPLQK